MATSNKLFVGSLPYSVDDAQLAQIFAAIDEVEEARVILDREQNNRSKGFGFVTMKTPEAAQKAIDALNGKEVEGRTITVSEARPQENRGPRPNGGNFNRDRNW
jgi:RNA recognition motif-containing protein